MQSDDLSGWPNSEHFARWSEQSDEAAAMMRDKLGPLGATCELENQFGSAEIAANAFIERPESFREVVMTAAGIVSSFATKDRPPNLWINIHGIKDGEPIWLYAVESKNPDVVEDVEEDDFRYEIVQADSSAFFRNEA